MAFKSVTEPLDRESAAHGEHAHVELRARSTDDLVFPGIADGRLDASALFRRCKSARRQAGLRVLRFHDLRHTFRTQVIGGPRVSILQLKEWMGHADIDTTMKYLRFAPRAGDADLVAEAFADQPMRAETHGPDPVGTRPLIAIA